MEHTFFFGGWLSQWYSANFSVDSIDFNCAEQYMMYQKAILFRDDGTAKRILLAPTPKEQKALGRKVQNFNPLVWDKHAQKIVYQGNHAKFTQNKQLLKKLMATHPTLLVEASPYDKIWGIGLSEETAKLTDPKKWPGKNLLGKTLTKLREDLNRSAS